jgi:phospholipase C
MHIILKKKCIPNLGTVLRASAVMTRALLVSVCGMKIPLRVPAVLKKIEIGRLAETSLLLAGLWLTACGGTASSGSKSSAMSIPTASIHAAASQIKPGESVVLTWSSANATSVRVDPSISDTALPLSGSATVAPASTTKYQLTAVGAGGSASSTITVTVTDAASPAPTVSLDAASTTVVDGGSVSLTWASSNATSVSIDPAIGTGSLPLNGSASVTPVATTTYTITGSAGQQTATASVTVAVTSAQPAKSAIQHLIVVIMQNHSFDNLFGTYPSANGLDPGAPSYHQVNAQGTVVSPTLLTTLTNSDLNHDGITYTEAYDKGRMDKYASTNGDLSMQYFDSTVAGKANDGKTYGMGTLWNYAQQYALADNFFASAMSSEPANMLYMVAATVHDARTAGSEPYFDRCSAHDTAMNGGTIAEAVTEKNVGDQLNASHVPWIWYQGNYAASQDGTCVDYVPQENPFQYFTSTQYSANLRDFSLANFQEILANESALPSVVWITPVPVASMHPGSGSSANGIEWLDNLVGSVKHSPAWSSTALIVLWDESGGWYDHVPPPQLANTTGLGARVPVIVISPYAKPGAISHRQMDFVSILRFIQWNWGLGTFTDAAQSARERQSGDICDLLTTPCSSP